jgi:hypothetical protein
MPDWIKDSDYYKDGLVVAHTISSMAMSTSSFTGYTIDDALENIHSCGWITSACLPAYKYVHLTMMRHGSPYQVIDPWSTSWYSGLWMQTIPRDIILGDTVGEAYTKGIGHAGILYITDPPQWWWDTAENVCFFGDPDLRVFTPKNEYSSNNYWEQKDTKQLSYDKELSLDGHMPYGAASYPHAKQPKSFLEKNFVLITIVIILLLLAAIFVIGRKKPKN